MIAVEGLSKRYAVGRTTVDAVRGVDFSIARGRCTALVGESGSGKTTIARLLLGIEEPSAGTIRVNGVPVPPKRTLAMRRSVQFVQQNPLSSLNPRRTVLQALDLPLRLYSGLGRLARRDRARELLALVGMTTGYLDRYPASLSGGQRQRVAIARALAAEPECIIFDEPTSALDVSVQARVLNLIMKLREARALTYLFITHDLSVVRNVADDTIVLYRGRIVESARTPDLFDGPRHRYTQLLLSSIPVLSDDEAALRPHWPWDAAWRPIGTGPIEGCVFADRCPFALPECAGDEPRLCKHGNGHLAACLNPLVPGRDTPQLPVLVG